MSKPVRAPEGKPVLGCYKYDAKAFAFLSLIAVVEAVVLVIWRGHLLNYWNSSLCPAVCFIFAVVAIVSSLLAFAGYIAALISASQYCLQVRSAKQ